MTADLSPGDVFAGHRIEALAGRGGMGVVYRATHIELERTVALKTIAAELADDDGFRKRFQQETRLLACLDHPHVIPVFEAGCAEGRLYVSMRWVDGADLSLVVRQSAGLDPRRAVTIVTQVASALEAAHAGGLVHRDVKPANVLLEQRDGPGEHAFLTDFGIGKRLDAPDDLTAPGQWFGSLDYIAPEQLLGASPDGRADVYSLGCVLFEALVGRVPFHHHSRAAKISAHLHEPPPAPRDLRPDLGAGIDDVIARAMAKDPLERYATAGALARAAAGAVASPGPGPARIARERAAAGQTTPIDGAEPDAPSPRRKTAPAHRRLPPARRLGAGLAAVATVVVVGVVGVAGMSADDPRRPAQPDPVPCTPAVRGGFDCRFYLDGDGITGGTPVFDSRGTVVGHLSPGRHQVSCQRIGRRERYGPYYNRNWARTIADNRQSGWVSAVYAKFGDNDGPFGGVPACAAGNGVPPQVTRSAQ